MNRKYFKKKKIGLALGGGAARGWSHIGVLRALEEKNINIDYIAGTSIGAFVGAFYAIGKLEYLENFALDLDWKIILSYFDVRFPTKGLLDGNKIYKLVSKNILHKNIEETKIPFCAVATNIKTGNEVRMRTGSIVDAVRASISIPGIFTPFKKDGMYLVDGGLLNPVPVDVVREMGADIVIAVDLNNDITGKTGSSERLEYVKQNSMSKRKNKTIVPSNIPAIQLLRNKYNYIEKSVSVKINQWMPASSELNIFDIIGNSINIIEQKITQNNFKIFNPDILIQPELGHLKLFDFDQAEATINEGYNKAIKTIENMK